MVMRLWFLHFLFPCFFVKIGRTIFVSQKTKRILECLWTLLRIFFLRQLIFSPLFSDFSSSPSSNIFSHTSTLVSIHDKNMLNMTPTLAEVKEAIFTLDRDSALGPDRFREPSLSIIGILSLWISSRQYVIFGLALSFLNLLQVPLLCSFLKLKTFPLSLISNPLAFVILSTKSLLKLLLSGQWTFFLLLSVRIRWFYSRE